MAIIARPQDSLMIMLNGFSMSTSKAKFPRALKIDEVYVWLTLSRLGDKLNHMAWLDAATQLAWLRCSLLAKLRSLCALLIEPTNPCSLDWAKSDIFPRWWCNATCNHSADMVQRMEPRFLRKSTHILLYLYVHQKPDIYRCISYSEIQIFFETVRWFHQFNGLRIIRCFSLLNF